MIHIVATDFNPLNIQNNNYKLLNLKNVKTIL
jgi:hypothetical protein